MKKQTKNKAALSTQRAAHSTLNYLRCKVKKSAFNVLQIIFITLMVVTLNACKRDMSERVNNLALNERINYSNNFLFNTSQSNFLTNNLLVDPTNNNNAYDSVGILHNLYLDHFASSEVWNYAENGNNIYLANALFCDSFITSYNIYNNYFGSLYHLFLDSVMREFKNNYGYTSSGINSFLQANSISNNVIHYIDQFGLIIDSISIYEELTIRQKAQKSVNSFKQIESQILNDDLLNNDEKFILLSVASVGRHSLVYAATVLTLPNNKWLGENEPKDPDVLLPEPIFIIVGANWEDVVRNDVLGAGGAGGTALARFIATGVGSYGIGFLMTLGGAAATSAAALINQIFYGEAFIIWVPFP